MANNSKKKVRAAKEDKFIEDLNRWADNVIAINKTSNEHKNKLPKLKQ